MKKKKFVKSISFLLWSRKNKVQKKNSKQKKKRGGRERERESVSPLRCTVCR